MNKKLLVKDNRGASLVLVIVALLFVGIIAAITLKVTVGNNKNVNTAKETSKNFYSTEDMVDDLKVYLQKFANESATEAYAAVLEAIAISGVADADQLEEKYQELKDMGKIQTGFGLDPPEILELRKRHREEFVCLQKEYGLA